MNAQVRDTGSSAPLRPLKGFMFDLDGTLLLSDRSLGGYELLPGAAEVLTTLRERAIPFVVLTNGSAYRPSEQAAKLRHRVAGRRRTDVDAIERRGRSTLTPLR